MQFDLPNVRGKYEFNVPLKSLSFLNVGGSCDIKFSPRDEEDLIHFIKNKDPNLPVTVLGSMSNTLILDGGIRGCVIDLTKHLNEIEFLKNSARVSSGAKLSHFINKSVDNGLSSCEKLWGIPGTIGGAVCMNAGIPEFEISDVLLSVGCIDRNGDYVVIDKKGLNMSYRNGNIQDGFIVTKALLKTFAADVNELKSTISIMNKKRLQTQPIGANTCGSTFKNPMGYRAWELIKKSGCDRLSVGGAAVSDIHCNFLVNTGEATADDFVRLISLIKNKVQQSTGVILEEEVKIIGEN
ncbi:MAG: UDP-N-acetylmuramate dehydrogenase [Holosporales bacterium]|jgi:UDP-N-acetylmuramate dehydrogenase|nr:UDP-N-acetylmuramate dehydrogenase [Holosporales bacterium]